MKITILYDNEVWKEGLEEGWGFSCLVEAHDKKILFDTGANGHMLLNNMEKLDVDPSTIDEVFISHAHGDHTGGLSEILELNPVKVYVPASFYRPLKGAEIIPVKGPLQLHENIFSTGEIDGIEQSLVVKIREGTAVIVGCAHPGVGSILQAASQFGSPRALVGGLHGFREFDLIREMDLVCPTHCTMHKRQIKKLHKGIFIEGGAGRVIEI